MRPSPEARFITACVCEPDARPPELLHSAAADVQDWTAVVTLAGRHCVIAYVRRGVARARLLLPVPTNEALRRAEMELAARLLALNAALPQVLKSLKANGVPVIVLKGPALARSLYADPALRPFSDLDLVVRASDEQMAVRALRAAAYVETPYAPEEARRARGGHDHDDAHYHRQFFGPGGRVLVELHTDPLQLGISLICEAARWQRALPVPGLPHALMLGPEDQLIQLSVHVHKHGYERLIWLKDIDLLLRAAGKRLDWQLIEEVARQEGVTASVWYTLRMCADLLGTPVPVDGLAHLRPSRAMQAAYTLVWSPARIANLDGFMRRRSVQFHAAESWRGVLPSLVLMGRRGERVAALVRDVLRY